MEPSLTEWAGWQRAAGLSERTITERAHAVRQLGELCSGEPTRRDVVYYLGRRGLAASTRATYHGHLRAYFSWCIAAGIREDDPMAGVPVPRRPRHTPRPVSADQLAALLAVCNRRRTRAMVLLGALAGLRAHEIAAVRGEDLTGGMLTVTGKGGKRAMVPAHDALVELAATMPAAGWWFPNHAGTGPVTAKAVGVAITRAMGRAGFDGTAHQLRHWYGSSLVGAGVGLRTVQELMRHESVQSTQIYTLVTGPERAAGIARLELPAAA